jgi:hypothetical protein
MVRDLEVTWSPAHEPSAADTGTITDALSPSGLTMLFPSETPVSGSTAATFILARSVPANESWLSLWVRVDDEAAPLVSVSTGTGSPEGTLGGEAVEVRGVAGEVLLVPGAVCFLRWQEQGQTYFVEFDQEKLPLQLLLTWLDGWQTLPRSSEVTSASATSTTLPPGVLTFDALAGRFEQLVEKEDIAGTLPYSVLPLAEVAWIVDAAPPLSVTDVTGYRLANGDVVLLFFVEPQFGGSGVYEEATKALTVAAETRFGAGDDGLRAFVDGDFGYVVVSEDDLSDLTRIALWARIAHQALIDGGGR